MRLTCADGRTVYRVISHIQRGYGLPDGICVLSYTIPAPTATDTELVTVHTQVRFGPNDIWRNEVFVGERSRITERLLAAERAEKEEWKGRATDRGLEAEKWFRLYGDLKADNAAKAARIK
ncbi:hypothetical protein GJU91_15440, partial [Brucella sp. 09RB8913]|nr:hypothetical protein [Brucella sp. 09RB8913]